MNLNINAFLATSIIELNTSLLAIYVIKHWFKTYNYVKPNVLSKYNS